jgi:hypothetical protein
MAAWIQPYKALERLQIGRSRQALLLRPADVHGWELQIFFVTRAENISAQAQFSLTISHGPNGGRLRTETLERFKTKTNGSDQLATLHRNWRGLSHCGVLYETGKQRLTRRNSNNYTLGL